MKEIRKIVVPAYVIAVLLTSCKKDTPDVQTTTPPASYDNGVFITNEGPFGSGTGTVSFWSRADGHVSGDIFQSKNGYPLGNVVQSMNVFNSKGYIIVNNANKIEVVDGSSMASLGTIGGLTYPRYFLGLSGSKGYVSQWGAGGIAGAVEVIDLSAKTVTATIPTGKGAENMLLTGGKVYVACSGGFDNDSVITVINPNTNSVMTNIVAGANPKNIKVDANGKIWVLCSGQWDATYSSLIKPGSLVRIDTATMLPDLSLPFSSVYDQPGGLAINAAGTMLYYSYMGKVFSHSVAATSLSASPLITRSFYNLDVDPTSGYIFCADAGNFSSAGKIIRYTPAGAVVDSFAVGVVPGNFYFK